MVNPNAKLSEKILDFKNIEQKPTRDGYGSGVVLLGKEDERVMVVCGDLTDSTRSNLFKEEFPERFVEAGIAEQHMASFASGLAAAGKIPFIASYAMFNGGRNWEQIRTTIAYNEANVKICGAHTGVSVGPDGATHQATEDMAIMRVIPNMTVLTPCDSVEAEKATYAAGKMQGPAYLRFAREKTSVFTTPETPFQIGKAEVFWDCESDPDVAIIGCGPVLHNAILAAGDLEKEGIKVRVINNHTIKPMDIETIIKAARDGGAIVTVEEHQMAGGMGSAVAEILAQNFPVPIEFVGVKDRFGESGEPNELIEIFGMGVSHIKDAVKRAIKRKNLL
ncbi:MAG: hypothetical protein UT37_C0003G0038 [Parcubacteria group bacterium GW2011_GWA2_39_18]|nr:MAG: hypothetical protein UT37_C0003G0038 [Parcubacteria group bacterium GW2011_GWA2_39_18]